MQISELIKKLQKIINEHGDLLVTIWDDEEVSYEYETKNIYVSVQEPETDGAHLPKRMCISGFV